MKCREFQSSLDTHPAKEIAANERLHLVVCDDCRRFLATRKDLDTRLALLREAAPPVSASLDAAVLANFRHQIVMQRMSQVAPRRAVPFFGWKLGTVVAGLVLVVGTVALIRKSPNLRRPASPQPVSHLVKAEPTPKTISHPRSGGHAKKEEVVAKGARRPKTNSPAPEQIQRAALTPQLPDSSPEGFSSLMYCDELSCGGGMEVVRVQLPPPASGFLPGSGPSKNVVSADVLVGSDGFARGIRIVH